MPSKRLSPSTLGLIAAAIVLLLVVAYLVSSRNPDQDKLTDSQISTNQAAATSEKRCSSQATFDLIKNQLFQRAAKLRGSDQDTYAKLAGTAAIRMENPVLESQDPSTGTANCSGSLSLDLPPDLAVSDGRHNLMADVDYTVQPATDGSGNVVILRNADAVIAPLATLTRVVQAAPPSAVAPDANASLPEAPPTAPVATQAPQVPQPSQPAAARPSFDCSTARTPGESAVCSSAGLAALDRNMAAQFGRAMSVATPEQQAILRQTGRRFEAYRDHCPDNRCIGDAYVGRMREIRDIMEGRWQPPR